ncbi:hypothetical protein PRIPAC_91863 [Pristionchus pacificus]|uniref:Uncharacterized protein n=1 Tax=Pristionchus pacificus TaxID=54126 RepID=A0A2A6CHM8_PRIPA|nr:hypothetical protein PRIPAC_91863 [Pristionchus pacificus]|eukprot:PDM77578.1 hypothetical protein PRIPAC_34445 [Pristionchus pacificus]
MERVGENRMIQFINVDSQQSFSNSFKKFVEYFEEPVEDRAATYNVISLEVSGTEMVDLVSPRSAGWSAGFPPGPIEAGPVGPAYESPMQIEWQAGEPASVTGPP